ncbi:MAG: M20/M25/M40 family metallo-hydrolase [Treponema sp.]|jgi:amidohydrolase|nr:M20/M25/M40 family metallo-hydrolase [Treponema sp.]
MDHIEEKIIRRIEENREQIIRFARDIYTHAELGYKEKRSAAQFEEQLRALKLPLINTGLAITGVKAYLKPVERAAGPRLALIGELDALRIPTHPYANPGTQAAHCCGHHAQLTGVIGAAIALADAEVTAALHGNVVFFAVPAEEYGEISFKNQLREAGAIRYGGGKCELIRIGAFDDISLSIAHHSSNEGLAVGNGSSNGFVSKIIRILGRAAHAAAGPHLGINAINAMTLGHTAMQFHRETYRDEDSIRIHSIITKGGDQVNVIPDEVVLEVQVRGKSSGAILDANYKTGRSYMAGADALGAGYRIETLPGYLPMIPTPAHPALVAAAKLASGRDTVPLTDPGKHGSASTDVGDLQHIQPVLNFNTGGTRGAYHSPLFEIIDEEEAYITTAKIFALGAYRLLKDKAAAAQELVESYHPVFTRDSYVAFMESLIKKESKGVEAPR